MRLVVDANVFMAALISRGATLELFFSEKLQLIVPDFIFTEMKDHENEILEKSGLSREEFKLFIGFLIRNVEIMPVEELKPYLEMASKISPDPDDVQYFALALKYKCTIWSNDSKLKEQSLVKVLNTEELLSSL